MHTSMGGDLKQQVIDKLSAWRAVLRQEASDARQVFRQRLIDRVARTPTEPDGEAIYRYRGRFTIGDCSNGRCIHAPWRSQRDSNPRFGLERVLRGLVDHRGKTALSESSAA
jgi:hypothetical protein